MSCQPRVANRIKDSKPSMWVELTTLAAETNAVNLGQGYPDGAMPKFVANLLKDIASHPERTDWHQYTRGFGHPRLVNVLGQLYSRLYQREIKANEEILVTVGADLALYYTFMAYINKGDEVLIIEPCYDCYAPVVCMAGGVAVPVVMNLTKGAESSADFTLDLKELENKCSPNTKMLVLNNPNNPTGKCFTREELGGIAAIAERKNLIVVADEVYEWHTYGQGKMIRFASLPGMFDRTISIGSAGKTFSITGWKLGWAIAPSHLLTPLKHVHQNCVFTCSTPTQEAVAQGLELELELFDKDPASSYLLTCLPKELAIKRDKLAKMLRGAGLRPIMPEAGYLMLADFSDIDGPFRDDSPSDDPIDFRFVRWLCKEKKLAGLPTSAFYSAEHKAKKENLVRFCFMKVSSDTWRL